MMKVTRFTYEEVLERESAQDLDKEKQQWIEWFKQKHAELSIKAAGCGAALAYEGFDNPGGGLVPVFVMQETL